ncbi:unnamed protein product [Adineta steineri]|uniref:G-protein coupled receptors family 1 profile domain-containing protein n=1 Tax=Adineta steineri TaxID=433720 RepID=A0A814NVV9_9BILA|nr:unnamed protein product [Adineta steineri]
MSSSNTTDADAIASWNNASDLINRYLPIFIYIFGITGNVLNVLILIQRPLRLSPSSAFFSVSSIAGLIAIISGLTTRMLAGYTADLTLTISWICKARNYVLYTARTVALWLIALATIDRWLVSSVIVHRRHISTLKNAGRGIILIIIFACLINSPIIYCYEAGLTGTLRGCYGSTYAGRVITDVIYAVITTIIPLSMMICFGLLTIRNIRYKSSRIHNIAMITLTYDNKHRRPSVYHIQKSTKLDKHLLKMLAVQVTLLVLLTCPHAIQKAYTSISSSSSSQTLQDAIATFIFNLVTLFNFTASGLPFYIYTLAGGSIYRNALLHLLKTAVLKILCRKR